MAYLDIFCFMHLRKQLYLNRQQQFSRLIYIYFKHENNVAR